MTFALALQSWSPLDNESITQLYIIQLSMRPARWKSLILHQLSISDTIQTFLIVVIVDCINLTSILVCCWFCHQSKPANLSLSKQSSGTPLLTNHLAFCHGKCIAQESGTRPLCQNIGFVCLLQPFDSEHHFDNESILQFDQRPRSFLFSNMFMFHARAAGHNLWLWQY